MFGTNFSAQTVCQDEHQGLCSFFFVSIMHENVQSDKNYVANENVCHSSINVYRLSQEERTKLLEGVPYVKLYRYNPKHLCPKLNGY